MVKNKMLLSGLYCFLYHLVHKSKSVRCASIKLRGNWKYKELNFFLPYACGITPIVIPSFVTNICIYMIPLKPRRT